MSLSSHSPTAILLFLSNSFCSKKQELRKMNTAPIHKTQYGGNHPPSLVITPPIIIDSCSGTATSPSPGGPDFMKSLTMSVTLDRRNQRKKLLPLQQPLSCLPGPSSQSADAGSDGAKKKSSASLSVLSKDDKKTPRVKSAPLTSNEGVKAVVGKKKNIGQSFSRIAILSAFFERKADQESGAVPRPKPHQRLFPWLSGKDKKYAPLICVPAFWVFKNVCPFLNLVCLTPSCLILQRIYAFFLFDFFAKHPIDLHLLVLFVFVFKKFCLFVLFVLSNFNLLLWYSIENLVSYRWTRPYYLD